MQKNKVMNINQIISQAYKILKNAEIPNPRMESSLIISDTLKICTSSILSNNKNLKDKHVEKILSRVNRRALREPYAYIIGKKSFYNLSIIVNKNVLIPRPETEHLIDTVLENTKELSKKLNIIDIGTGSGAILCSLLHQLPNSYGIGTDISKKALTVAKKNIKKLNLNQRSHLINTSWGISIKESYFDILTCNPPYIEEKYFKNLQNEIKNEPSIALKGGMKGLEPLKELLPSARKCLKLKGKAFFEIGYNQCNNAKNLISNNNFKIISIIKDLSGIERVIFATAV